jgi:hypothetical protein
VAVFFLEFTGMALGGVVSYVLGVWLEYGFYGLMFGILSNQLFNVLLNALYFSCNKDLKVILQAGTNQMAPQIKNKIVDENAIYWKNMFKLKGYLSYTLPFMIGMYFDGFWW